MLGWVFWMENESVAELEIGSVHDWDNWRVHRSVLDSESDWEHSWEF